MKKVIFTVKVEEAKTFNTFGAATIAGNEALGEGMFRVGSKGGIYLIVEHPAIKEVTYVKQIIG